MSMTVKFSGELTDEPVQETEGSDRPSDSTDYS